MRRFKRSVDLILSDVIAGVILAALAYFWKNRLTVRSIMRKIAVRARRTGLRVASKGFAVTKCGVGCLIMFVGLIIVVAIPLGIAQAVQRAPLVSNYNPGIYAISLTFTSLWFASVGVLVIGLGSMYAVPETRLGRHFRHRVFVRRSKAGIPDARRLRRITIAGSRFRLMP